MPSFSQIKLYLQPHVAKYMEGCAKEVSNHPKVQTALPEGAIFFDQYTPIGRIINEVLTLVHVHAKQGRRRGKSLVVWISDDYRKFVDSRSRMVSISDKSCDTLNSLIGTMFSMHMYYHVLAKKANGVMEKDSIAEFLRFYNITEDDYSLDAAKKSIFRNKKKLERFETKGL